MIDLRRLRVLRAVAHHGTVTAAARALHFTPSAASQQIRQLGRELDVVLLEPHGRRVRLTRAARSLLTHADAIEARWELAEADLRAADREPVGLLRVCGFPTAVSTLLAPLAARIAADHPRLTVEVTECDPEDSFDRVFSGAADLAVVEAAPGNPPVGDGRFEQRMLLDDLFDLVVHTDHPFATRSRIDLHEAADEPWVMPAPDSNTCLAQILAACNGAGFTPSAAHRAVEWNAIAHLIAYRLGVTMIPRLAHLAPHLPIARVPLSGTPSPARKLFTCIKPGSGEHPAIAAALDELHRLALAAVPHELTSTHLIPATSGAGE